MLRNMILRHLNYPKKLGKKPGRKLLKYKITNVRLIIPIVEVIIVIFRYKDLRINNEINLISIILVFYFLHR